MQRIATQHRIVTEFCAPITLTGDRERIRQVVTNLLTNAIKYSPQADRINLCTAQDGDKVIMAVQDFGIGIPKAEQAHIFERFYRVDAVDGAGYEGLGLGLFIAAEFVERHCGDIWVESEEGQGSTIACALPLNGKPNQHGVTGW